MAFGNKAKPSKIYSYKCKSPRLNAELVREQMSKEFNYRRQLVPVEQARRQAVEQAVQRHFPLLAQYQQRRDALATEIEQLRAVVRARNAVNRKRQRSSPEHDRIKELTSEKNLVNALLKEQREAMWQAHRAVAKLLKEDREGAKMRWTAEMIERAKQAIGRIPMSSSSRALACDLLDIDMAENSQRRELRANCGLYWGTYLAVEATVKHTGRPPKQHRWTGHGKLAVQIQSSNPLSTEKLFGGTDTRVQLDALPPDAFEGATRRGKRPRVRARFRIGTAEDGRTPIWCDTLVTLHRPLPTGQVQWVYLIRTLHGFYERWELQFVVAREEPWTKTDNATTGVVGIDVGWRFLPNGDLRVAYWAGDDGREGQLVIPDVRLLKQGSDQRLADWPKLTDLQSTVDGHRDKFIANLRQWLATNPTLPDWWAERAEHVTQWRSHYRLYNLCRFWRTSRFTGDERIMLAVTVFIERVRHLLNWKRCQEAKLLRWRAQHYRRFVAILRRQYHTAVIENCDFRKINASPAAEEVDERSRLKLWRIAAVGELHRIIKEVFAETVEAESAGTTSRHHACGQSSNTPNPKLVMHHCENCGVEYDQDQNAAHNLRDAFASGMMVAKAP